jgi:uridine phosphorylase
MYREMTAADHHRVLGIDAESVPDIVFILGVLDVHAGTARFSEYLERPEPLRRFPGYLATHSGFRVGLCGAFGAPMAAFHAHTWIAAGAATVVQLGWYGALQPGTQLGDVCVPRHAERQDGASDWYLPKGILADASSDLSGLIAERLRGEDVTVHQQAIYSTPALLAESRDVILDWSRHGYHGVDMETAATLAVGRHFGVRRAAALLRYDDLIAEEDHLAIQLPRERRQVLRSREVVVLTSILEALAGEREAMEQRV